MTETAPPDLSSIDGRKASMHIELDEDAMAYTCTRVFGALPERVFRAFTDPADLRVWFPSGAPPGSELTVCESDPVEGGAYHYAMVVPDFGPMSWYGTYTSIDRPDSLGADEWFVMGDGEPDGEPSVQTLTFEALDGGRTHMTMRVATPEAQDPEEFMEQAASGLSTSMLGLDELVSG